jgi:hypothetical protein
MDGILSGIAGVICYLDDILVVGISVKQHDERLQTVLQKLTQVGLRLKKDKCEFGKPGVEYLGHLINDKGLRPTEKKVLATKEAPDSKNVTELKSFSDYSTTIGDFCLTFQQRYNPCAPSYR